MASLIAQLVATRRRIRANRINHLPNEKSNYVLNAYDERFKAEKHNFYTKYRTAKMRREMAQTIAKGKKLKLNFTYSPH